MLKFAFKDNVVPPDRYRWTAPNGAKVEACDRHTFYSKIEKIYQDNSIPMPSDWREKAEHQACLLFPPGWAKHETGEGFSGCLDTRMSLNDYLHGTRVLAQIALSSDALVDQEVAESRAAKCAACPANIPVQGCLPCVGFANLIMDIKGAKTTPADQFLKTCAVCKCSNEAQVWVKKEILSSSTGGHELSVMEQMPDCWKYQEIMGS